MKNSQRSTRKFWRAISATLACGILASCNLGPNPRPTTETVNLREGLGLSNDEGWIILSRPNSMWTVGTVIEVTARGQAKDIGTLSSLGCFPSEAWIIVPGAGADIRYGHTIDYNLSVSATFGVPKAELAKVGLNFGGDGSVPTHRAVVVLNKVSEQRVDMLKAEEYLQENFGKMSSACERNLLDPKRFIVDKILQIKDGEIGVVDAAGIKVDLSSPIYQVVQKAAIEAGYKVTTDGSLKVSDGISLTFAIRQADFGSTLARMGIERRGAAVLKTLLQQSGEALPY